MAKAQPTETRYPPASTPSAMAVAQCQSTVAHRCTAYAMPSVAAHCRATAARRALAAVTEAQGTGVVGRLARVMAESAGW